MTRIYENYDGDNWALDQGRWARNARAVLTSKRGQKVLREIEAALVALPEKRLAYATLIREDPETREVECCVLGAYARHKGVEPPDYLMECPNEGASETADWASSALGMTMTLAYLLIEENDEALGNCSPEVRYKRMLAFVRSKIASPA